MGRRAAVLLALAVFVLATGACGGSVAGSTDATPAREWAGGLCSALTTWTAAMSALTGTLDDSGLSKESLTTGVQGARSATQALGDDLRALGRPDTSSGAEAQDSLDRLVTGVEADIAEIERTVDDISGVTDLVEALPAIGSTLSTMGKRVQAMLGELEQLDAKGELEDAFSQADACDFLTS